MAAYLLALALAPAADCPAQPASAVDQRGKRITLDSPPARIVSLAPSNTEILFALGLGARIVGDTAQCNYPPEARTLPHVGDYRIQVEKVLALHPSLVVAVTSANRIAIAQLERTRIPVFCVDPHTLAETRDAILRIGQITDRSTAARKLVSAMAASERDALKSSPPGGRPRVLVVLQARPLYVAGGGNFMDEVVSLAGGDNVGRAAGPGFHMIPSERAIMWKPDVILAGKEDSTWLQSSRAWQGVPAIRNHALFSPPQDVFSRPGPRLPQAIGAIRKLIRERAADGRARTGP